jgi:hypothetical protein
LVAVSGCAVQDYVVDRARDAADTVTLSAGIGIGGVKVRVGPLSAGLFNTGDVVGLRGGQVCYDPNYFFATDTSLLWHGGEEFYPSDLTLRRRGKLFMSEAAAPFILYVDGDCHDAGQRASYYGQIEAAVGVFVTLRGGLNLTEVADFLLGWFTIDILDDDIGTQRAEGEGGG